MEPSIEFLIAVIGVMAVATFLTRALPFLLLYKLSEHPLLLFLGRYLPPVLMVLLLLYAIREPISHTETATSALLSLIVVTLLHIFFRQPLLSILSGTAIYMLLVQG